MAGVLLSAFHQFTGINGVIFNSNQIFTQGMTGLEAEKAARLGTFFLGVVGFLGEIIIHIFIFKFYC
jgi:hypothetical protein